VVSRVGTETNATEGRGSTGPASYRFDGITVQRPEPLPKSGSRG
jgi:hypothetical protein